jgi:hypothetical protein
MKYKLYVTATPIGGLPTLLVFAREGYGFLFFAGVVREREMTG